MFRRKIVCIGRTVDAKIRATTPTNKAVSAGTSFKLGCETETGSRIRWHFNGPMSQHPVVLFNGFSIDSSVAWRISVNVTEDWNELTIRNVGNDDSGVYTCHEFKTFSNKVNFRVIVTGMLVSRIILIH